MPPGTVLTVVNGNMDIRTAGTVIENKDIRGCVSVNASNVIIRRSKISANCILIIWNYGTNLLVEDVEIICPNVVGKGALGTTNFTARRVNAHHCDNTFWIDNNALVEDSYIHDAIPYDPVTDPHTDGIQIPGGGSNITLRHNRIYGGYASAQNFGNSAITMGPGTANIQVIDNILAGGGYTIYCGGNSGASEPPADGTGNAYTNNRFSRIYSPNVGGFGPWYDCLDENISGNVYHGDRSAAAGPAADDTSAAAADGRYHDEPVRCADGD